MNQSCVGALARAARAIALTAVVTGFGASALAAQGATGKLEGRVFDQNQQPVANAQIVIEGTSFATTANPQGYYFFNGVPAGVYSVRFAYIGYKAVRVEGLRIISGQTITLDRPLEATNVELQEITVVGADNPLVPRDQVATKQLIDGAYTDKLPVDRLGAVFALQPGVMSNSTGTSISVRGSRPDENTTYIDGVPVQPGNRSTGGGRDLPTLQVGTNAFEDASITTGAASSEFGNAQGGIISITTRTGGQKFTGNIGIETDEFSGLRNSSGFSRIQASVGGPITKQLTFFVGSVLEGTTSGNAGFEGYKVPVWVPVGVDTVFTVARTTAANSDSVRLPVFNYAVLTGTCSAPWVANAADPDIRNNFGHDCQENQNPTAPNSTTQLTAKLNYSFGQGSRLAATYVGSRNLARGQRGTDGTNGTTNSNNVAILNWNQVLSRSSDRAIALDLSLSYQWDRSINALLTPGSEADTRDPFGGFLISGFDYVTDIDDFKVTDELIRNFRTLDPGKGVTLFDRFNRDQFNGQPGFANGAGNTDNRSPGNPGFVGGFGAAPENINTATENRLIARGTVDWQLDRYNRVKIGGQYIDSKLTTYNPGASTLGGFPDIFLGRPTQYNLFAEDRLDLGDVVLVGGVRYDYFDVGASKSREFPRISSAPGFTAETLDDFLVPFESHNFVSPHVQVAFPVTDRTNFRLSYAQAVQTPDFSVVLSGNNTDLSITNTNFTFGQDLEFGRTITFEFGFRHAVSDDMVIDVAVFNKDNIANAAGRLVDIEDPRTGNTTKIRVQTNQDFGNTRGIDMRMDRRIGNFFNGVLSYSYQDARSTGSDPFTFINFGSRITSAITGGAADPPQAAQPVAFSRPHNLAAQFSFNFPADYKRGTTMGTILNRVNLTGTARYSSGTAYTRCKNDNDDDAAVLGGGACNTLGGDFNGARVPDFRNLDIRASKGFRLGSLDFTAYADARNVLNIENVLNVFAQTGSTNNDRLRTTLAKDDSITFARNGASNGVLQADGSLALPSSDAECANWVTTGNNPSPPLCYFFRKGEQRFGNGDGIYTLEEQRFASEVRNLGTFNISRFAGAPRRIRFGMEVNF